MLKETKHCHTDDRRRLTMSDRKMIDLSAININAWVKSVGPRKSGLQNNNIVGGGGTAAAAAAATGMLLIPKEEK